MNKSPVLDPTSLGNILLEWNVITPFQLGQALREQATLHGEDLLGRLLVAAGACTEEELAAAVAAQDMMRTGRKSKGAIEAADLALRRMRRASQVARRENVIEKANKVAKSITGDDHPAVDPSMLAKPENS